LQDKKQPYFSLWQHIHKISVDKIRQNYETLGCTFDTYHGESDAQPYIDTVLEIMKKHGAYVDDGCLIMDVKTDQDTAPMPPVLLQKANGGDLYATTDIAAIHKRYKAHKPDRFVYIADSRQKLHFEQVFRTVKKSKIVPPNTDLVYVGFGTMNGPDGRPFKTRSGDTIKLEDVFKTVTEAAEEKCKHKSQAPTVGLAALKFADLSNHVRKDYVFDIEKFTSFEGKTGPYLLYTIARINSIFKKATPPNELAITPATRDIVVATVKLADSYTVATETYTLSGIVECAYNLASKFNLLYANENIQNNKNNLAVARLVKSALVYALDTLAIKYVNEM
jgi:arginyl-tRNA synthetase